MKNKKGLAPFIIFVLVALGVLILTGVIGGAGFSSSLANIPPFVWILLALFMIIIWLGRKKK